MPQKKLLSQKEYEDIEDYVASTAPPGLTEDEFYMLVDQEIAGRQGGQSLPAVPMPDTNKMAGTRGFFGTGYQIPTNNWEAMGEFGGNALRSAGNLVKGIGQVGMTALKAGLAPGSLGTDPLVQGIAQAGPTGIVNAVKDRYGSADALAKTAWEDPVGLAFDVQGAGNAVRGAARVAGPGLQSAGQGLMRRAANVPERVIATSPYQLDDMTIPQTLLEQGANPTTGGRRKLDRVIAPLGNEKGARVDASTLGFNAHDPATTRRLRQHIIDSDVRGDVSPQLAPAGQDVLNTFTRHSNYNQPLINVQGRQYGSVPVQQSPIQLASDAKVQLGKEISDSAWATNPVDAATEAQTLAKRALYGDLQAQEARIPGVAALNEQLDPLYAARDHLVKGIGVPEHYVSYPSVRAAAAGLLNNTFGAAGGFGARGMYQTGRAADNFASWLGPAYNQPAGLMGAANAVGGMSMEPPPQPPSDPSGEAFQQLLNQSDPIQQTFGPAPRGPEDDWWSPVPRLKP